eukprot:g9723.t1
MWGQKHQSTEEEFESSTKCSDNSGGKEKELADGVVSPSGRVKMTVDRQLLYKAVGHVYSKLVMPGEEGGLKDWIQEKCVHFSTPYKEEHFIMATEIYNEYELLVEKSLVEFCAEENIEFKEFYSALVQAKTAEGMGKTVDMLLAAASYKKFYKLMHRKWKEVYGSNREKIEQSSPNSSLNPHSVKIMGKNSRKPKK